MEAAPGTGYWGLATFSTHLPAKIGDRQLRAVDVPQERWLGASRHFSQELACSDVARALVPAASALLPTLPSTQCHSRAHVSR
jgi:hypothetical protein